MVVARGNEERTRDFSVERDVCQNPPLSARRNGLSVTVRFFFVFVALSRLSPGMKNPLLPCTCHHTSTLHKTITTQPKDPSPPPAALTRRHDFKFTRKRAAAAKRMKNGEAGGWKSLSKDDREFIATVFKEYDVAGSGILDMESLPPLLQRLAGGVPPTEEETREVLDKADNDKSGAVSIDELKDVIRIWYVICQEKSKLQKKKNKGCCVM